MGTSQSKTLITLTFGAGAVTITTGLVWLWLASSSSVSRRARQVKHKNVKPIMGLSNVGSTCYLNSVLQALAACNNYTTWMAHKDDANKVDFPPRIHESYSRMQYPMIAVIYRAILVINRQVTISEKDHTERVPADIIRTLKTSGHKFHTSEEQDTFEFFQFLVGILFNEVQLSIRRAQLGSLEGLAEDEDTSDVSGEIISISDLDNIDLQQKLSPQPRAPFVSLNVVPNESVSSEGSSWSYTDSNNPTPKPIVNASRHSNNDLSKDSAAFDPFKILNRVYSTRRVSVDASFKAAPRPPFKGMTSNQLQCLLCNKKTSVKLEPFDSITLMLSGLERGDVRSDTVMSLLQDYLKPVNVHQVDCAGCTKNLGYPVKSSFIKKTLIARLPPTLCIHILRTCWTGGTPSKRTEYVRFPERLNLFSMKRFNDDLITLLDEEKVQTANSKEISMSRFRDSDYRLMALISHYGDTDSGHFITYRRSPSQTQSVISENWFRISDESVEPVTLSVVLATNAYMLFYERAIVDFKNFNNV